MKICPYFFAPKIIRYIFSDLVIIIKTVAKIFTKHKCCQREEICLSSNLLISVVTYYKQIVL